MSYVLHPLFISIHVRHAVGVSVEHISVSVVVCSTCIILVIIPHINIFLNVTCCDTSFVHVTNVQLDASCCGRGHTDVRGQTFTIVAFLCRITMNTAMSG